MSPRRRGLDARHLRGDFAVIGDVHGCAYTLNTLLERLGGSLDTPVPDLTLISVGDLHDNAGPDTGPMGEPGSVEVLRWALRETKARRLIVVDSNHGQALVSFLTGKKPIGPKLSGAELTAVELASTPDADTLIPDVIRMLSACPPFARFTGGPFDEFVVAHAAVSERTLDARALTAREISFHVRAHEFRWTAPCAAITGHVSVAQPTVSREVRPDGRLAGPSIRIDTGVDQGGSLTAYLPSTHEFISVPRDIRDCSVSRRREKVPAA